MLIEPIACPPAENDRKVAFTYDYLGRRIRKTVSTYNSGAWSETGDLLFIHDDWHVIMVLDANQSNQTDRTYAWGLGMQQRSHA